MGCAPRSASGLSKCGQSPNRGHSPFRFASACGGAEPRLTSVGGARTRYKPRSFGGKAAATFSAASGQGFATFQYPNRNRASTVWYHDHAPGMTRLNVDAGPAGFYLIRGGPARDDAVLDNRFGTTAVLPGPAPNDVRPREAWESGFKDTVVAYPGEVTRVRAKFDTRL